MTKNEYIDFIKNGLPKDDTAKYHSKQIEYAIEHVFNQVYRDMAEKSPKNLEKYSILLNGISAKLNTNTDRYSALLPYRLVDLPTKSAGVLEVRSSNSSLMYVPMTSMEMDQAYGLEATLGASVIGFSHLSYVKNSQYTDYAYKNVGYSVTTGSVTSFTDTAGTNLRTITGILAIGAANNTEVSSSAISLASGEKIRITVPYNGTTNVNYDLTFGSYLSYSFDESAEDTDYVLEYTATAAISESVIFAFTSDDDTFDIDIKIEVTSENFNPQTSPKSYIEFFGMTEADDDLKVRVVPVFSEYASTDQIYPPYGQDFNIVEQVRQALSQIPPRDLTNDNQDSNG